MSGFLVIWSDLADSDLTDWAHWMTREHAIERLGIAGFRRCRIFRALTTRNSYVIVYDLDTPEVVASSDYVARLNAPTPWSQRTMPKLKNFRRGGGHVTARAGVGDGGVIAMLFSSAIADAASVCGNAVSHDRIASAQVLSTDAAQTGIATREKAMRSGDASFETLVMIEGLDEDAIDAACAALRASHRELATSDAVLYGACFSLAQESA
ncbi:hypothetical protein GJW-30_1_01139 [Variibacter gotjawalensis]|uniref:Uncharacterized protein n=1 Tax=Variibacter gotjawalensis TaxID=1333996 RepID=A0A0S3PRP6_9BRAD|nr:hypothetical protein [Variibacter gotjawalensis]NIK48923.1 hypothetical protein [Variibacter gotjawalensis]RZS50779.1 hypothetical protein EV661_3249 [Variibacter gotjawalensis]BAT58613.1 hypothetical protein GJW-30_1_01139 [Variibacter gotjawalensis]